MSSANEAASVGKNQPEDDVPPSSSTSTTSTSTTITPWPHSRHANDGLNHYYGRDLVGYGGEPPDGHPEEVWPGGAKVALNFVINYEEGGEACLLHGDQHSESLLSEIVGAVPYVGERHANMESLYDYGARTGFWRLQRLFVKQNIPCTVFAVGMALERHPPVCAALQEMVTSHQWEVASHGYRWIDYQNVTLEMELEHIVRTVDVHERLLGRRPVGLYQGKPNVRTRDLVVKVGGFKYDSDSYADDLPYWCMDYDTPHLIIPYTLSENDMRFVSPANFATGAAFATHLKDSLRYAVQEGRDGHPTMMSVGLHCRLARPGRVAGLADFVRFVQTELGPDDVWICTREQIAAHWYAHHSPTTGGGSD